jgi:predicted transcriptional regulator
MERARCPSIEDIVRTYDAGDGVHISQVIKSTGLSEIRAHEILYELARQGVIKYDAADQIGGERRAHYNGLEEEHEED